MEMSEAMSLLLLAGWRGARTHGNPLNLEPRHHRGSFLFGRSRRDYNVALQHALPHLAPVVVAEFAHMPPDYQTTSPRSRCALRALVEFAYTRRCVRKPCAALMGCEFPRLGT